MYVVLGRSDNGTYHCRCRYDYILYVVYSELIFILFLLVIPYIRLFSQCILGIFCSAVV